MIGPSTFPISLFLFSPARVHVANIVTQLLVIRHPRIYGLFWNILWVSPLLPSICFSHHYKRTIRWIIHHYHHSLQQPSLLNRTGPWLSPPNPCSKTPANVDDVQSSSSVSLPPHRCIDPHPPWSTDKFFLPSVPLPSTWTIYANYSTIFYSSLIMSLNARSHHLQYYIVRTVTRYSTYRLRGLSTSPEQPQVRIFRPLFILKTGLYRRYGASISLDEIQGKCFGQIR